MPEFIRLESISKVYRSQNVETKSLTDISLQVEEGDFVSIMGPSGCGKTTLLNIIGMLDRPTTGNYIFDNRKVNLLPENSLSNIRKNAIGFVFQNFNLIEELTVFENVELPLFYRKVPKNERKDAVNELLDRLGMMHKAQFFPSQLSGGQQQRTALARAVVGKPKVILADEPTGNLDSVQGNEIMEILSELNDQGATVLMVTHSPHDASFSKRLIKIVDGKILSENTLVHG